MSSDSGPSSSETDAMLNKLEQRIDTLKRRYERYFMGLEQRPPNAMRRQVVREVHEAENTHITNTAQKFKLRSLVQKFNTNKTRWNRIMRQIEEGRYHRDRNRAKRRQQRREQQEEQSNDSPGGAIEIDPDQDHIEDLDDMDLEQVFDQPAAENQQSPPANNRNASAAKSPDQRTPEEKERIKRQRLAEIQKKLGLSGNQTTGQQNQQSQQQQTGNPSRQPSRSPSSSTAGNQGSRSRNTSSRTGNSSPSRSSNSSSSSGSSKRKKLERMRQKLDQKQKKRQTKQRKKKRSSGSKKQSDSGSRTIERRSSSSSGSSSSSSSKKSRRKDKLRRLKRNLDQSQKSDD